MNAGNPGPHCMRCREEQSWMPGKCHPLTQSKCDLTPFHHTGLLRWCRSVIMSGSGINDRDTKVTNSSVTNAKLI